MPCLQCMRTLAMHAHTCNACAHLQCMRTLAMHAHTCNACTHLQCMHTLAMHAHTCNACTHLQCMHTLAMHAHTCNACTHLQCMHTLAMHAHTCNACTHLQCMHTLAMHAHTCNACAHLQCMHTNTRNAVLLSWQRNVSKNILRKLRACHSTREHQSWRKNKRVVSECRQLQLQFIFFLSLYIYVFAAGTITLSYFPARHGRWDCVATKQFLRAAISVSSLATSFQFFSVLRIMHVHGFGGHFQKKIYLNTSIL